MAKKTEQKGKKRKKDSAGPREAVRGAVESTFQAAAGGASRAQELLDDIAGTVKSLRDANLVETLESVRDEVQSLARRVAALELRQGEPAKAPKPAATRRASTSTTRTGTARKPAARKPASAGAKKTTTTAAKKTATTAAKKTTTAAKKPASAARKPAARKPAATRSTTRKSS